MTIPAAKVEERLRELLQEIAEGRGPFKLDNHEFANSVIENSKANAKEALRLLADLVCQERLEEAKDWNKEPDPNTTRHEYHVGFDSRCAACRRERLAALSAPSEPYKGAINIPCSACSAGDTLMEYHDHEWVKQEHRRTAPSEAQGDK